MFNKILNRNIIKMKELNKYNQWLESGHYFGMTYKNNKSHCLLKYKDMNDNIICFDEITNNLDYLKNNLNMSLIDDDIIPIFDFQEKIYLKKKFT